MNNTFLIDFETTGLNPYHDEIIEFAIKKYLKVLQGYRTTRVLPLAVD